MADDDNNNPSSPKPAAFRFKSKRAHSPALSTTSSNGNGNNGNGRPSRSSHKRHRRYHPRRRPPTSSYVPRTTSPPPNPGLNPDTAFRESLFDAMADDEGAAFWEGVYGQPIHTYSQYKPVPADDPNGEPQLERMSDDEYITYVRGKMWEKSHAHIIDERARRAEQRRKGKEDAAAEAKAREQRRREWDSSQQRPRASNGGGDSPYGHVDFGDADSWARTLNAGLGRRKDAEWGRCWARYVKGWEVLRKGAKPKAEPALNGFAAEEHPLESKGGFTGKKMSVLDGHAVPWPTRFGRANDVSKEAVEEFLRRAPQADDKTGSTVDLLSVLKVERVRWHPDKIQQRFGGGLGIDEATMKSVTAVFQIIDHFWTELKES